MFDVNNKELKIEDRVVCSIASTGHLFIGKISKFYVRKREFRNDVDLCTVRFLNGGVLSNVSSERVMKLEKENQNE